MAERFGFRTGSRRPEIVHSDAQEARREAARRRDEFALNRFHADSVRAGQRAAQLRRLTVDCPRVATGVRWQEFIERLRGLVPAAVWDLWLSDLHSHGLDGQTLVVGASPSKTRNLADRYGRVIEVAAQRPVRVVGCRALQRDST